MKVPDIIIAVDGYSSTGKSTFAKKIAAELSFLYLDSGALYRAVTLYAIENKIISETGEVDTGALFGVLTGLDICFKNVGAPNNDGSLDNHNCEDNSDSDGCSGSKTYIGDRCVESEIRTLAVSDKVSKIAAIPQVRDFVNKKLREIGEKKRVVMDGRDIGTTVFPNAELKIFMTADVTVRAQRRAKELQEKGENADFEAVLKNLQERDHIDSHREESPLMKAPDAVELDNSYMTLEEQMRWVLNLIADKFQIS